MTADLGYGTWMIPDVNPQPWTSPTASIGRRGGKLVPNIYKSQKVTSFQEELREYLENAYETKPFEEEMEVNFWFWRNITGNEKKADATNLQKSTEDALHGILFKNDSQVRRITSTVMRQGPDVVPFIIISWEFFVVREDDLRWDDTVKILAGESPATQPRLNFNPEDYF